MTDDNIIHFNPWGDFNDAPAQVDPFGAELDREQIAIFLEVVFGYCEGWVPLRGFVDKGQGIDGRPHNVWVEDDVMYVAYYNAGLRAVDVSGTLGGDLGRQGREIAALATSDADAFVTDRPFTWGPQVYRGLVYASDHTSGLWIARLRRNAN